MLVKLLRNGITLKKRFSKVIVGVFAVLMLMGGLAGCGEVSSTPDDGVEPSVEVRDGDAPRSSYGVVTKEVKPGQFVTCVVYNSPGSAGGLSCDWEGYHAEYDEPK